MVKKLYENSLEKSFLTVTYDKEECNSEEWKKQRMN